MHLKHRRSAQLECVQGLCRPGVQLIRKMIESGREAKDFRTWLGAPSHYSDTCKVVREQRLAWWFLVLADAGQLAAHS